MARRIFVTGVAGMIGSNVARALVSSGESVVGMDNYWRGTRANISDLLTRENFSFRYADLASDDQWSWDMTTGDVLVHIADIVAGIDYVFSNEWSVFSKNVAINTLVARVANMRRPDMLLYLGTACSYPQKMQRSVAESVLTEKDKYPADPESGYGWSKLIGEIEFGLAVKGSSTRLMVLDLHNVYGWPCVYGDKTAQVIPSLINRALRSTDDKLVVWGDGKQGRAFVHVDDVVAAICLALDYRGGIRNFMIGPDRCTTIAETAAVICSHPGVKSKTIVFDTSKPTGDIGRFADYSLARDHLGWQPNVEFRQGIHELIDRIIADVG
jgi:GDP-D-mannose 3', 5'-epimerase